MRGSLIARAALVLAVFAGPTSAAAQQPTAFVHGLRSDGGGWGMLPFQLLDRFPITAIAPTLGWDNPLGTQANTLNSELANAGFDNPILIGHSNGGLVSRQTSRMRQTRGVMTIGTLHGGAPLAGNLGGVEWVSAVTFVANILPSWYFDWLLWCWDCYYYDPWTWWITYYASQYDRNMAYVGGGAFAATVYMGFAANNVLPDMVPGSAFLTDLNSSGNLSREASEVATRVGIGSNVWTNYGLLWNGVAPEYWYQLTSLQYTAADLSVAAWFMNVFFGDPYYDPYYWDKFFGAWLFLDAAYVDYSIDPWWCQLIGAWNGYCLPSDAIVPLWSQQYPGWGQVNYQITGPSHTQEKQSYEVYAQTSFALANDFSLPPRY